MTISGSSDQAALAEKRLLEALERDGARDPREFYRARLKELRDTSAVGYDRAVTYYSDTLLPGVASGDIDPLGAWLEYGRVIVDATAPGRTIEVDARGRRSEYSPPTPRDRLVLHLPDAGLRALVVGLPRELSAAQRATFDLLVNGKLKLQNA